MEEFKATTDGRGDKKKRCKQVKLIETETDNCGPASTKQHIGYRIEKDNHKDDSFEEVVTKKTKINHLPQVPEGQAKHFVSVGQIAEVRSSAEDGELVKMKAKRKLYTPRKCLPSCSTITSHPDIRHEAHSLSNQGSGSNMNAIATRVDQIRQQIKELDKEEAAKPKVELLRPSTSTSISTSVYPEEEAPELEKWSVAWKVNEMLCKNVLIDLPEYNVFACRKDDSKFSNYITLKLVWWFLKNEADPADEVLFHPELHDNEKVSEKETHHDLTGRDCDVGSISDDDSSPDEDDPMRSYLKRIYENPHLIDEFCGFSSLETAFRKPGSTLKQNEFVKVFFTHPGSKYDKPSFNTFCNLCKENIVDQRPFGAHIRSERHQNNFRNCSLAIANYTETLTCILVPNASQFRARLKIYYVEKKGGKSIIKYK